MKPRLLTLTGYGTGTLMATVLVTLMILVGTSCRCTDCDMSFGSSGRPWPSNEGLAVTAVASVNKNCKGVIVDESVTNPSADARLTDDEQPSAGPRLIWPKGANCRRNS